MNEQVLVNIENELKMVQSIVEKLKTFKHPPIPKPTPRSTAPEDPAVRYQQAPAHHVQHHERQQAPTHHVQHHERQQAPVHHVQHHERPIPQQQHPHYAAPKQSLHPHHHDQPKRNEASAHATPLTGRKDDGIDWQVYTPESRHHQDQVKPDDVRERAAS